MKNQKDTLIALKLSVCSLYASVQNTADTTKQKKKKVL